MNKNKRNTLLLELYYTNSIRTSGEVKRRFILDVRIICKLVLFICTKLQYFAKQIVFFFFITNI